MKGELESIRIEAAENGFMVSCSYAPKKAKKGEMQSWPEPERYVYAKPEQVAAKVTAMLAGGMGKKRGGLATIGEKV